MFVINFDKIINNCYKKWQKYVFFGIYLINYQLNVICLGGDMNKTYRLKSSKAFEYIHRNGKSVADRNLVLIISPTKFNLKVGFSVSKKLGKAVVRNKVKRRLREGFRKMIPYLSNKYNYVIIARQPAKDCNYNQLLQSMKYLLAKVNVVTDTNAFNTVK